MVAFIKPIPSFLTVSSTSGPVKSVAIPNALRTSAAPDLEDAAIEPCFTTRAPAAVVTIAADVEILTVFFPSPPVPTGSTALSAIFIGKAYFNNSFTISEISVELSPLFLRAKRKSLMSFSSARPSRISRITSSVREGVKSAPEFKCAISADQLFATISINDLRAHYFLIKLQHVWQK